MFLTVCSNATDTHVTHIHSLYNNRFVQQIVTSESKPVCLPVTVLICTCGLNDRRLATQPNVRYYGLNLKSSLVIIKK